MEVSPNQTDLTLALDRANAAERRARSLESEIENLERKVREQQEQLVAAKEANVTTVQLEAVVARQELEIAKLRERLSRRGAEPEPEVRLTTSLRSAAAPRMLAVPELRWIAEIVEAE